MQMYQCIRVVLQSVEHVILNVILHSVCVILQSCCIMFQSFDINLRISCVSLQLRYAIQQRL